MKDLDYWDRFLNTGRIEDYLAYRSEKKDQPQQNEGEVFHAGTNQCYRDDIKG